MEKSSTKKKAAKSLPDGVWEPPSRDIKRHVESMLWGRAAGRCEFAGCNRVLSRSSVTQEQVNVAQKAHIYAFSPGGSRGHEDVPGEALNLAENLMLVCHECHRKIDQFGDGGRYTARLLQEWKAAHEQRVELVTGIDAGRRSHVLFYGANVGVHSSPFVFNEAAGAMFPGRYPAEGRAIALGVIDSTVQDKTPEYWASEANGLVAQFRSRVGERLSRREIDHLSVFALAPQPLLVLLGTLLGDIVPADVYQRHREPPTWCWPSSASPLAFKVERPATFDGPPALVLGLSATVTRDRVESVLGSGVRVWNVSVPGPHNDLIRSREHLSQFRALLRQLFDEIKAAHGQTTTLHVFPVGSVSFAVELGRARMPKADMPWCIYDQNNERGGFVATINIPFGDQ